MELQRFGSMDLVYADRIFCQKHRLYDNFAENLLLTEQAKPLQHSSLFMIYYLFQFCSTTALALSI